MVFILAGDRQYKVSENPRIVLDILEKVGYRVVACVATSTRIIWTLNR